MIKDMLKNALEQIEARIDLDHAKEVEQLHLDAIHYNKVSRIPLTVEYPVDPQFKPLPFTEVFNDPEKMLYNELASLSCGVWNSVRIQDDYPLQIRPNYGVGMISSLFGAEIKVRDDVMPWVVHLEDEDAFRDAIARGIPDLNGGLAGKMKEAYEVFAEWLRPYPKCAQAIRMTQPDMQGPFDNLHLLRGGDIFYDLYDDPDMVHEALDVITETMIGFQKAIPQLNDRAGDAYYIHKAIYSGAALIKLDTETAMISEEMFEEFCKPYNKRVLEAVGGGSIHFCGGGKTWPNRQMPDAPIGSLNFGNPEMQDLISGWGHVREKKINIVGYGQGQKYDFVRNYMDQGIHTGVTFLCQADDSEEARRVVEEHREYCAKHF